jgi:intracellular sulfur oxidation DsrE/DsrF family protein
MAIATLTRPATTSADQEPRGAPEPEEKWLRHLNGRHRQFFDTSTLNNGAPLTRVANFLDVYRDAYGVGDRDVNAIVGAHGTGLGLVFSDAIWERFGLGEYYSVADVSTERPATRNPYSGVGAHAPAISVASLQRRGVRFLGCQQSINRVARELARKGKGAEGAIRNALADGLLPGVTLVPAMVVAANRAQESGLAYLFVG